MHYNFNLFYMSYMDDEEIKIDIGDEEEEEDDTFSDTVEDDEVTDDTDDDFIEEDDDELKEMGLDDSEL